MARKGEVSIRARDGRLQLVWNYQGRRYYKSLGLPDSKVNRAIAVQRARAIELDMALGTFDFAKYQEKITCVSELFKQYLESKILSNTSCYEGALKALLGYTGDVSANKVGFAEAERCVKWLMEQYKDVTARNYLARIKTVWAWAVKRNLLTSNPWATAKIRVRPQQPKPFTKPEVMRILSALEGNHYEDFVLFLFSTGCRIGEAIALKWEHITDGKVWILATKTNRGRIIALTPDLHYRLTQKKAELLQKPHISDFIFPSPDGVMISHNNFRRRVWMPLLKELGIEYRKPYCCRSTFVSHAISSGLSPTDVANIAGHSPTTLFRHYYGSISSPKPLPSLF